MNWDLAAFLVILIAISLVLWLYDIFFLMSRRNELKERMSSELRTEEEITEATRPPFLVDLARSLLPIFIIVLMLRSFLIEPFRIPSGSMMPTLLVGDFILVNKFTYGIRLPVINHKIIPISEPKRGDVVVFRYPEDPKIPYIKRVVGLPGDHVVYHIANKMLYINDEPIPQKIVGSYQGVGEGSGMTGADEKIENLQGVEHSILLYQGRNFNVAMPYMDMTIPPRHYFVLGDNRDNSRDSRFWGTVPEENLIGKAFLIWMNWDRGINSERIGQSIR
jgi:signal peptidase I